MSEMDRFEAWWKTLGVYDPALKALAGSAWAEAVRAVSKLPDQQPQPAEDPDEWVIQDRVPVRVGIDEIHWSDWDATRWEVASGHWFPDTRYGSTQDGAVLSVRCRRRDLPKAEQAEQWPKYYTPFTIASGSVVFVRRDSPDLYTPVMSDGEEGVVRQWHPEDDSRRKQLTEAEAMALTGKPEPAEDPDEWVIQDRVPRRVKIDQFVYLSPLEMSRGVPEDLWQLFGWSSALPAGEMAGDGRKHGFVTVNGNTLHVRCRRRDLPKVEQPQLDVIGTLSFDPATGEYSRKPQPQKTRVRLWKNAYGSVMSNPDCEHLGGWHEIHHDSEGFYVEQGQ